VTPKTATALVSPVFIKGSAVTIYELIGGKKLAMQSFAQMTSLAGGGSPSWLTMNEAYVESIQPQTP
jgi:hypothetical protein